MGLQRLVGEGNSSENLTSKWRGSEMNKYYVTLMYTVEVTVEDEIDLDDNDCVAEVLVTEAREVLYEYFNHGRVSQFFECDYEVTKVR